MDNSRLFLFAALVFVAMLLWQQWQADYGPKPLPPAELQTRFDDFAPQFLAGVTLAFDGRPAAARIAAVEIPPAHQQQGLVPSMGDMHSTGVRLPMRIRHSSQEPASPYWVRHRGYWFYIDDTDLESKRIFETIVTAYQSRLGSVAPDAGPVLTLPVGRL